MKQCKKRLSKPDESEFVHDAAVKCQIIDKPSTESEVWVEVSVLVWVVA